METSPEIPKGARLVGYAHLAQALVLDHGVLVLPHHIKSYVGTGTERQKVFDPPGSVTIIHPKRMQVGDNWVDQLEFALRYEGVHLDLFRKLVPTVSEEDLVKRLRAKPAGSYLRKIWYLFEHFTGRTIDVPELTSGNYVDLLDSEYYYTSFRFLVKRQRINQNLLGDVHFCTMVRRTKVLREFEEKQLDQKARELIAGFPSERFHRASNYLYRKETKSSFEIEHETPDQRRASKFVTLLKEVASRDFLSKEALLELQNLIVDPRFANQDYRHVDQEQIYVGATAGLGREIVHFAGPKPEDVSELMGAFLEMARIQRESGVSPVVLAASIAYAFVFIHPFSDGNGRIHRFLIHHILARTGFTPQGVVFPVSAVMLSRLSDYDASLESFSKPLMELVNYELDDYGKMTVLNDTANYYRAIDCTTIAETLFRFVEETIQKDLPEEMQFLESYDEARVAMRQIVDLPDRIADLLIRLCLQNGGRLSNAKRKLTQFEKLTDGEVEAMQGAVMEAYKLS